MSRDRIQFLEMRQVILACLQKKREKKDVVFSINKGEQNLKAYHTFNSAKYNFKYYVRSLVSCHTNCDTSNKFCHHPPSPPLILVNISATVIASFSELKS